MKFLRRKYQNGSLRRVSRKTGVDVWEYRFRDHAEPGSPLRQMTLSTLEYPTETSVRIALQSKLLEINGPTWYKKQNKPTFGVIIDRFIQTERLEEIVAQPPGELTITDGVAYSTAAGYLSYLRKHIRPTWGSFLLVDMEAMEIQESLRTLALAPKTRGHLKNLMSLLFDRARLWKLTSENPMSLVKVKGISKRLKRRGILSVDDFVKLIEQLPEPYKPWPFCHGHRPPVSEILALTWERLDFENGTMLVSQGAVNGRIGDCKTEDSADEVPLAAGLRRFSSTGSRSVGFPWGWFSRPCGRVDASTQVRSSRTTCGRQARRSVSMAWVGTRSGTATGACWTKPARPWACSSGSCGMLKSQQP